MNIAFYDPETFEIQSFIKGEPRPEALNTPEGQSRLETEKSRKEITESDNTSTPKLKKTMLLGVK